MRIRGTRWGWPVPCSVGTVVSPAHMRSAAAGPTQRGPGSPKTPGLVNDTLGSVLLSHAHVRSTIAAGGLNCRVRDGNGCTPSAMAAKNGFLPIAAGTMSDS